jgi:hypothetical protein
MRLLMLFGVALQKFLPVKNLNEIERQTIL